MSEDVFAPIEEQLKKEEQEQSARKLLTKARSYLLLGRRFEGDSQSREAMAATVFFSTIALRLEPVLDWSLPTLATDGKTLRINPGFFAALGLDHAIGVVTHEVLHVANKHHCRLGTRDLDRANIAMDLAVNCLLLDSGLKLPSCALVPGQRPKLDDEALAAAIAGAPRGLSFEEYYALLPTAQTQDDAEGQEQDQGQDPGGCGAVQRPGDGSPSSERQAEAEAEVLIAQAQQAARQRGALPAGLARLVEQALTPTVDWRQVLREFVSRFAQNDFSWARPNRRYVAQGLYLPGRHSEELGEVLVAVDTSGSIGPRELATFASELQSILDCFACTLTILYHDAAVAGVQTWQSSDGPLVLEPRGGGGTDHRPVFAWVEQQPERPTCMVCLTDLYSCFPDAAPDYPVLWASTVKGQQAPWGQLVEVTVQ